MYKTEKRTDEEVRKEKTISTFRRNGWSAANNKKSTSIVPEERFVLMLQSDMLSNKKEYNFKKNY